MERPPVTGAEKDPDPQPAVISQRRETQSPTSLRRGFLPESLLVRQIFVIFFPLGKKECDLLITLMLKQYQIWSSCLKMGPVT